MGKVFQVSGLSIPSLPTQNKRKYPLHPTLTPRTFSPVSRSQPSLNFPMIERIFNTVNDILMITVTLATLAAPVVLMCAYWILCSSH